MDGEGYRRPERGGFREEARLEDSGKVDDDESEVSKKLREKLEGYEGEAGGGGVYSLHEIVTNVVTWTNDILQNMIAEKPLAYEHISSIPNDNPKLGNSYSGYTLMRKSEEGESRNTRFYIFFLCRCDK